MERIEYMSFNKHKTLIVTTIALLTVIVFGLSVSLSSDVQPINLTLEDVNDEKVWMDIIRDRGGNDAFRDFVSIIQSFSLSNGAEHESAHVFGGTLYKTKGIDGISACGSEFSYGCFHEFIGGAVSDMGIETVNRLNETCIEKLGAEAPFCQHGIGHGIQATYGYTKEDLDKALSTCSQLRLNDPIGGCAGGIYMEYDFQTMLGDDGEVRESEDIFSPCSNLSEEEQLGCVFWRPQWWWRLLYGDETDSKHLSEMGRYCSDISKGSEKLTEACFSGLGNTVVMRSVFDPHEAKRMCNASSHDQRHVSLCFAYAANRIARERSLETGLLVCNGLKGENRIFCEVFATNQQYLIR